ncbi:TPA: DUF4917 family protein, partial [Legionella pneumophila]|nr:DUF4917 family protein [Legionella pneumophila]
AHIRYDSEDDDFKIKLRKASEFLKNFHTVLSLNYDLVVYWVMHYGNVTSETAGHIFKDCFTISISTNEFRVFEHDWEHLRSPHQNQEKSVLIFYPHGNLTLARLKDEHFHEIDLKICSPDDEHLKSIFSKWCSGKFEPIFVAEGPSELKKARINESSYLSDVFNCAFLDITDNLVVYGWSMRKQDQHILNKITEIQEQRKSANQGIIKNIAVSVYVNGNENEYVNHVLDALKPMDVKVDFYYACDGCWCY